MMGKQVAVQSDHMPLQNGSGALAFTAPAAEPAAIAIYNDAGSKIRDALVNADQGANAWTWDGTDNNGNSVAGWLVPGGGHRRQPDGTTRGAALQRARHRDRRAEIRATRSQLQLGALTTDFTTVQSVGGAVGHPDSSRRRVRNAAG